MDTHRPSRSRGKAVIALFAVAAALAAGTQALAPAPAAAVTDENPCWDPSWTYVVEGCEEDGGGLGDGGGGAVGDGSVGDAPADAGGDAADAGGDAPADARGRVARNDPWPEPPDEPLAVESPPSPPDPDPPPAEVRKKAELCASIIGAEIETRAEMRSLAWSNLGDVTDTILDVVRHGVGDHRTERTKRFMKRASLRERLGEFRRDWGQSDCDAAWPSPGD